MNLKIDKKKIEVLDKLVNDIGIEKLNCSALHDTEEFSNDEGILVNGELFGGEISSHILIAIHVYNESHELIGVDYSSQIRKEDYLGFGTFSQKVRVANDGEIAKIRVYTFLDPADL